MLLGQTPAFSQNYVDLANVYWRFSPQNKIKGSGLTRDFSQYVADVKLPVPLNDKNVFIAGLEYQQNQITTHSGTDVSNDTSSDYTFASSTIQLGVEHKWNDRSKMLFIGMGRLNTDYTNVTSSHFQLGGLALGTTARSDKFDWKYGLYYNAEFFGSMFVPLFGFNWEINEKWRLKTVLPINLEVSYHPNSWLNTGLRFDGVNGSFCMDSKSLLSENTGTDRTYLDKADNNVWLFTEFHLGKNVWFHLKGGHSVLRKYRFYESTEKLALKLGPVNVGDDRPVAPNQMENGWSFECRFIYRLPI